MDDKALRALKACPEAGSGLASATWPAGNCTADGSAFASASWPAGSCTADGTPHHLPVLVQAWVHMDFVG